MPSLDVFNEDAFSLQSLTAAVNKQHYRPGQVSKSGIFHEDGVTTTTVSIEHRDGSLSLVEPTERGGPGETAGSDDRSTRAFPVPHYQRDDFVKADEVQNVRAFGTENELETLQGRVESKAFRHAQDLTMTLEHQRVGAIKGIVTTKSGAVLSNLYTEFGIAQPAATSLELDQESTDVLSLLTGVQHELEDALDEPYEGLHVFAGRDLHTQLWNHKSVKETLLNHIGATNLRNAVPDVFELGAFTIERYKTGKKVSDANGGAGYIANDEARIAIKGVDDLFLTRFAPADYEETVNTIGLPFYAKQFSAQNGKGRHLEFQMNVISICTRPETLKRLTLT